MTDVVGDTTPPSGERTFLKVHESEHHGVHAGAGWRGAGQGEGPQQTHSAGWRARGGEKKSSSKGTEQLTGRAMGSDPMDVQQGACAPSR